MNLLLEQNKQDVIQMYKSGISTNKIAEQYECNAGAIWLSLTEWGIKIKKRQLFIGKIEDYYDIVLDKYYEGKSAYCISKETTLSKPTVLRILKKHKLSTSNKYKGNPKNLLKDREDEVVQLYNEGKTCDDISKITSHSAAQISVLLKNSEQDVREWKYGVNEHFFDKVDNEVVAYTLGWFYSDGCVDDIGKMRIQIQKDDEAILYVIKNLMGYTGPLYEVSPPKKFPHRKSQVCLAISRKILADKLILLGCMPNKSLQVELPSFDIVPEHLFSHFIRGVFDGDGGISIRHNTCVITSITSCDKFVLPLGQYLLETLGILSNYYYRNRNKNTVTIMTTQTNSSLKFLEWMYKNATYYLERKFKKYEPFITKNLTTTNLLV
jgi:intein-encoded DNA endonuclease-like protein